MCSPYWAGSAAVDDPAGTCRSRSRRTQKVEAHRDCRPTQVSRTVGPRLMLTTGQSGGAIGGQKHHGSPPQGRGVDELARSISSSFSITAWPQCRGIMSLFGADIGLRHCAAWASHLSGRAGQHGRPTAASRVRIACRRGTAGAGRCRLRSSRRPDGCRCRSL